MSGPASDPGDKLVTISGTLSSIEDALTKLTETVDHVRGRFYSLFSESSRRTLSSYL